MNRFQFRFEAVDQRTVKAARDYLHSPAGEAEYKELSGKPSADPSAEDNYKREKTVIVAFLNWDVNRVEEALAEIAEIEDPKLSKKQRKIKKEIIEKMPSQKAPSRRRRAETRRPRIKI